MNVKMWSMRHPHVLVTNKRRADEAERAARKWETRYHSEVAKTDRLQAELLAVESRLQEYEEREAQAQAQARKLSASPVHPTTMIGRNHG